MPRSQPSDLLFVTHFPLTQHESAPSPNTGSRRGGWLPISPLHLLAGLHQAGSKAGQAGGGQQTVSAHPCWGTGCCGTHGREVPSPLTGGVPRANWERQGAVLHSRFWGAVRGERWLGKGCGLPQHPCRQRGFVWGALELVPKDAAPPRCSQRCCIPDTLRGVRAAHHPAEQPAPKSHGCRKAGGDATGIPALGGSAGMAQGKNGQGQPLHPSPTGGYAEGRDAGCGRAASSPCLLGLGLRQRQELPSWQRHLVARPPARLGTVRHRTPHITHRTPHTMQSWRRHTLRWCTQTLLARELPPDESAPKRRKKGSW